MSAPAETIAAEGVVLRRALEIDLASAVARLEGAGRVWLVGTGTSEHAAWLGAHDLMIAATAAARRRAVLTLDRGGFADLPGVTVAGPA